VVPIWDVKMNIKVMTTEHPQVNHLCGGEYATCELEVFVSTSLTPEEQREVVIHAILENYLCTTPHEKIEELTDLLIDGLNQIETDKEVVHPL